MSLQATCGSPTDSMSKAITCQAALRANRATQPCPRVFVSLGLDASKSMGPDTPQSEGGGSPAIPEGTLPAD